MILQLVHWVNCVSFCKFYIFGMSLLEKFYYGNWTNGKLLFRKLYILKNSFWENVHMEKCYSVNCTYRKKSFWKWYITKNVIRTNCAKRKMPFGKLYILKNVIREIVHTEKFHSRNCTCRKIAFGKWYTLKNVIRKIVHTEKYHSGNCTQRKMSFGNLYTLKNVIREIVHTEKWISENCNIGKISFGKISLYQVKLTCATNYSQRYPSNQTLVQKYVGDIFLFLSVNWPPLANPYLRKAKCIRIFTIYNISAILLR